MFGGSRGGCTHWFFWVMGLRVSGRWTVARLPWWPPCCWRECCLLSCYFYDNYTAINWPWLLTTVELKISICFRQIFKPVHSLSTQRLSANSLFLVSSHPWRHFSTLWAKFVLRSAEPLFRTFQNIFPSLPLSLYLSTLSPDVVSFIVVKSVWATVLTRLGLRCRVISCKLRMGWFFWATWKTARQLLVLERIEVFIGESWDLTCHQSLVSLTCRFCFFVSFDSYPHCYNDKRERSLPKDYQVFKWRSDRKMDR